jgi:chromosome segregation ATPase
VSDASYRNTDAYGHGDPQPVIQQPSDRITELEQALTEARQGKAELAAAVRLLEDKLTESREESAELERINEVQARMLTETRAELATLEKNAAGQLLAQQERLQETRAEVERKDRVFSAVDDGLHRLLDEDWPPVRGEARLERLLHIVRDDVAHSDTIPGRWIWEPLSGESQSE